MLAVPSKIYPFVFCIDEWAIGRLVVRIVPLLIPFLFCAFLQHWVKILLHYWQMYIRFLFFIIHRHALVMHKPRESACFSQLASNALLYLLFGNSAISNVSCESKEGIEALKFSC